MISRLEQILRLQDLDLLIREMSDQKTATQLRKIGFSIEGLEKLREARGEIATEIDRDLLSAYDRLMVRYPRAVSYMKNGVCLACFIKQPTQLSAAELERVRFCEQCKRILYAI